MRTPSPVIYDSDYTFEFGRGHVLRDSGSDEAVIVSSGRGVHEALAASVECARQGVRAGVVDMPSIFKQAKRAAILMTRLAKEHRRRH